MKKLYFLILFLFSLLSFAQNGITYQAVILNPKGEELPGADNSRSPLVNQTICLRFKFVKPGNIIEYQETQVITTDEFGMVNVIIGTGIQTGGTAANFSSITWNGNPKNLVVELDVEGNCSNFKEISNQPFTYVPYAYYSANSGTPGPTGPAGPQGPQGIAGPTGATGPAGATGPVGPQGIQGVPGPTGPTGSQGPIGLTGATGAQGIQGVPGPTGSQGPIGLTGAQGIQGVQGPTGAAGSNGIDGKNTLVKTTTEAAGANCATGGTKVEVGLDVNSNGVLDTAEVNASLTKYVCNGAVGATGSQGPIGLTGATGATGAQGIQGVSGATGATGSNGADGKNTLVKTTTEAAGANCATGGTKVEVGLDVNSNGVLDTAEVNASLTKYVCNGAVGATGSQGPIGLTGATGATGAQGIQGVSGATGATGSNGADGKNTLVKTSTEAAGANCATGGTKVEVGLDANSNGVLDTAEGIASLTKYVCNGAVGATGSQGIQGVQGATGATGSQGVQGAAGLSAYQIWLNQGNTGSQIDFINNLNSNITQGTTINQMLYWNGSNWTTLNPGINNQVLSITNGILNWQNIDNISSNLLPQVQTLNVSYDYNTYIFTVNSQLMPGASANNVGFVWGLTANPTINSNYVSFGTIAPGNNFSATLNISQSILPNTTYYFRSYASSNNGVSYGQQLTFTTGPLLIGQNYQGGIIVYIDNTGSHGIVASQNSIASGLWGCSGTAVGAEGTAIGTGLQNTNNILIGCSQNNCAARMCDNLVLNGYSDWYLPSKDELYRTFICKQFLNNNDYSYWSSSEYGTPGYSNAWYVVLATGGVGNLPKNYSIATVYVRAVRNF